MGFNPFDNFNLFGGGKGNGVSVAADPYAKYRNEVLDWLYPQIGKPGKQYGGEMVAPMSGAENQSLDFLKQFGDFQMGDTFNNAKAEVNKTLTDQYDPTTSPYYQAVKAEAARNLDKQNQNIASNAAGGGRFWSGARLKEQGNANTDVTNKLNTINAEQYNNERNRKMGIIPQAMAMNQAEMNLPLQKASAFQTLGALPRNIQQALDTSKQNEWQRSEIDYPMQIAQMLLGLPGATYQQNGPSGMQQLLQGAGSGIGSMLPFLLMSGGLCWIAKEIFGGWYEPKTIAARNFINNIAPKWFKDFYIKHGEIIAEFISDKPLLKMALQPLFEIFALIGREGSMYEPLR